MNFFHRTNCKHIAIVAVLGFVVIGGIVWYANFSTPVPEPIEISNIKKPTLQQTVNTSTWQTYRNEEFGFEVKYPQGWKADSSTKGVGISKRETVFGITIEKSDNPKRLSFEEWIKEAGRGDVQTGESGIVINGVKAYRFDGDPKSPSPFAQTSIVFIADKHNRIFTLFAIRGDGLESEIIDQILSAFRFSP